MCLIDEINKTENNILTGPIPTELGLSSDIKALNIGTNDLTGTIPIELGNTSGMLYLALGK